MILFVSDFIIRGGFYIQFFYSNMDFTMKSQTIIYTIAIILTILSPISCTKEKVKISDSGSNNTFIKISKKNPRQFETTDGNPWIPIMINLVIPNGEEEEVFPKVENYFKNFSQNGGNAMRIWISSPFLEIEDTKVGEFNPVKIARIDSILHFAEKYDIRIKFTLQHIRSIKPSGSGVQAWSNRPFMSVEDGGPFKDINEYINTEKGRTTYLNRVKALSRLYKDNHHIFSWELWNEMDAVDDQDWLPFTVQILDSVKMLFPNHLVAQTLGSMHSADADKRYVDLIALKNNDYTTVHRYLDPGTDWGQYEQVHGPIDLLISSSVQSVYPTEDIKPVVDNEHGAVEPNHTGPHHLYLIDSLGIFIHDMIFTPFFCGTAGSGAMWHWDSYIEKQNLWFHFQRFKNAITGIDPVNEEFVPFTFNKDSIRFYGLRGKNTTMIWCRDAMSNWKTELQEGIPPKAREHISFQISATNRKGYENAKYYDPWSDIWTDLEINNESVTIPSLYRSGVVVLY